MKTVKLFSIALAGVLLVLSACKKDSKEPSKEPGKKSEYVFKIDPTTLRFTNDGGTKELTIKASDFWEATVDADWCTLSAYRGNKNAVILVTAEASTSKEDTANGITFLNAKGGYIRVTIIRDGTKK